MKPEFWRDRTVGVLPDQVRLLYIGLWMQADDDGWLRVNVPEIAADLYVYMDMSQREEIVEAAICRLVEVGRVIRYDCGHGYIPRLVTHQRLASPEKRVLTYTREHKRECVADPRGPAGNSGEPAGSSGVPADSRVSPTRNGTVREGTVGKGKGGSGGDASGVTGSIEPTGSTTTEFQLLVPRPN